MRMKFESQVQQLLDRPTNTPLTAPQLDSSLFEMPKNPEMSLPSMNSFFKVKGGNVVVITLGVIFSSTVAGFISRFLSSYAQYAAIIAGALIMYFAKSNGMLHDFGIGVFIAGLAQVFSGIGGMFGGLAGGTQTSMVNDMSEDRLTYGGTDGVYPTQPERRTMR